MKQTTMRFLSLCWPTLLSLGLACSLEETPITGTGGAGPGTAGSSGSAAGASGTGGAGGTTTTAGSAGDNGGGSGGTSAGSAGTGGSGIAAGNGGTGGGANGGGPIGSGGSGPEAGSTAGSGPSGGASGGSSGGATPDAGREASTPVVDSGRPDVTASNPMSVLNGQKFTLPCVVDESYSNLVCVNNTTAAAACPNAAAPAYIDRGFKNRDETITIAGTPGTVYDVTLRVRGVVEPKHYQGGTKDTVHDGFYAGGTPVNSGAYNVYMISVSDPPAPGVYYLNAVNQAEGHFDYLIDYTVTIPIATGARVRFLAADANCSAIKNCDPSSRDTAGGPQSDCHQLTVPNLNEPGIVQPVRGQFIVLNLVSATPR